MRASLALTIILYAIGLTVWTVVQVFRPRARIELSTAALVVLEFGLILQAAVELFYLMSGYRPAELATHLAYLAASVAVLPIVVIIGRSGQKAPTMTDAVACAAVVIIVVRLQMTWTA